MEQFTPRSTDLYCDSYAVICSTIPGPALFGSTKDKNFILGIEVAWKGGYYSKCIMNVRKLQSETLDRTPTVTVAKIIP